MLRKICAISTLMLLNISTYAENTLVNMHTSLGTIKIELFDEQAPLSVENFKGYVKSNFYNDTIFHRVIPNFMVQGGGMTVDMTEKPNGQSIINESNNGLKNLRGTLAMARTSDPHSAKSQFFINVVDNDFLNKSQDNAGYAVFGQVIDGMSVIDQISHVPTRPYAQYQNVPIKPIKIFSVTIDNMKN